MLWPAACNDVMACERHGHVGSQIIVRRGAVNVQREYISKTYKNNEKSAANYLLTWLRMYRPQSAAHHPDPPCCSCSWGPAWCIQPCFASTDCAAGPGPRTAGTNIDFLQWRTGVCVCVCLVYVCGTCEAWWGVEPTCAMYHPAASIVYMGACGSARTPTHIKNKHC